ncbi:TfuA-like protein [Hyalangium versicolor]|uniref:TfuA-like protein n=1 Tax=Hyalangium versicolor TaxID=2861190 RepID=UPI001CCB5DF1|nr:TfuA-like protein [Hyalangium versicolor]
MIYVFAGPTLSAEEGRAELDAEFLSPAAQGDVYRAALSKPEAIGLIDGYFERVPAVWHKELLWAMAEGIHVYGSASMGALRAAELAPFGMHGVGAIFEAFRHGDLEDDDEVTVVHAPEEAGFRTLSEAMVNIRATLAGAERAGVLRTEARVTLERIAKGLYYPERSYPTVLSQAAREGIPDAELERLRGWLPHGHVNQKREDALAMLRTMREELASHPGPKQVTYSLARTDAWEEACRRVGAMEASSQKRGPPIGETAAPLAR